MHLPSLRCRCRDLNLLPGDDNHTVHETIYIGRDVRRDRWVQVDMGRAAASMIDHVCDGEQQRQDERPSRAPARHALGYRRDLTASSRMGGPPALCAPCAHRAAVRRARACIILSSCSLQLPGLGIRPPIRPCPPATSPASGLAIRLACSSDYCIFVTWHDNK
jgi:hypothetical protein